MSSDNVKMRDGYIDVLRAFGLLCLIVAHTSAPLPLTIFRTFDVPLMVFISGICFHPSGNGYTSYVKKRVKRIYYPVFVFLTIFFFLSFIGSFIIPQLRFSVEKIVGSYLLLNHPSIGYVWIMRVFLFAALLMPLIYRYVRGLSAWQVFLLVTIIFVLNETTVSSLWWVESKWLSLFMSEYLVYILAYSIFVILGIWSKSAGKRDLAVVCGLVICGFFIFLYVSNAYAFFPQQDKYPPHGEYILYGTIASMVLWYIHFFVPCSFQPPRWISFLSRESMWLYLWHIIPAYTILYVAHIPNLWVGRYLFVLCAMIVLNHIYVVISRRFITV